MASKDNDSYNISGYFYNVIIPSFADFVFLFIAISSFGMCCGYYEKILLGEVNFTEFYKKRYLKILPFFSVLVLLDLIMGFNKASLYEAIADVSLTYGLFPNNISVIGVGWFLGLIFTFYFLFPFYCVLIETKKRAWVSLGFSLVLNYIGAVYFDLGRTNIVYAFCFFIAGGLVYLYKDKIELIKTFYSTLLMVVGIITYFTFGANTITRLFVSVSLLIFAIGNTGFILKNKFTAFISELSMEIYLSHMVIFRAFKRLHFNSRFGNGIFQYIITFFLVLIGTIVFSLVVKKIIGIISVKNEHVRISE